MAARASTNAWKFTTYELAKLDEGGTSAKTILDVLLSGGVLVSELEGDWAGFNTVSDLLSLFTQWPEQGDKEGVECWGQRATARGKRQR